MKILHLSTSDLDGGAARAAYRLHQGLQKAGHTSTMLVRAKTSADNTVLKQQDLLTKLGPTASQLPLKFLRTAPKTQFSPQAFPDRVAHRAQSQSTDIIHLHWVCNGYLQIESLTKLKRPLTWTLHDMWPLTGGCHYSQSCTHYKHTCGHCPQLASPHPNDLSHRIWQRKAKAWKQLNLTLIAPSRWIATCAQASALFHQHRIEVIPHGLDTHTYKPLDQTFARQIFNLPANKQLILFGASSGVTNDPRKGFQHLKAALHQLKATGHLSQVEIIVFGIAQPTQDLELGFPTHYLGKLHDDITLALAYAAADVMVVPSEQETFGQTASEALACGTPVVAFNATGLKDIVTHQQTGYLAHPFDSQDLAQGITWVLSDPERHHHLRIAARQKAETEFSLALQAQRHLTLYQAILDAGHSPTQSTSM